MTTPTLQQRFLTALNDKNFGQAAHHLDGMDAKKALAAIPLVLDYLKDHERERRERDRQYTRQKVTEIELHDLHPNLIPAALWTSMVKKLNGSKVRYNDKESVETALDVLQLAVQTRRDDVLPHILDAVHRIRRGKHYESGGSDGRLNNSVAVRLLGVLNRLDEHKKMVREGHRERLPQYIKHVQDEAVNREVRVFR